jgi:hypothetical protein
MGGHNGTHHAGGTAGNGNALQIKPHQEGLSIATGKADVEGVGDDGGFLRISDRGMVEAHDPLPKFLAQVRQPRRFLSIGNLSNGLLGCSCHSLDRHGILGTWTTLVFVVTPVLDRLDGETRT